MKLWFTASELADLRLPGLPDSKRGIAKLADRDGWAERTSLCRTRAGVGGGLEYHIDLLPHAAKVFYTAREIGQTEVPVEATRLACEEVGAQDLNGAGLESRDARLMVIAAYDKFIKAEQLNDFIGVRSFSAFYNIGQISVPSWVRSQIKEISPRTLQRWRKYARAGETVKLAVDRGAARRGRGQLDTAEGGAVKNYILALVVKEPHYTAKHIARITADKFPMLGTLPVRTVQNALKSWKATHKVALTALTNPDKFKSSFRLSGRGAHPVSRLNQMWQIDASPADVLCVDGRYSIYVAVDIFSRRAQVYVSRTARAEAVCLLMRRAIFEWGIPELVKTDNGSDFIAKSTVRLFAALGIETERSAAFSPWQKGEVERVIGTIQRGMMTLLDGFIGHSVADRKVIENRKSFAARLGEDKKDLFNVSVTAAELQRFADEYVKNDYHMAPHSGVGMNGETPFARAASYAGSIRKIADPRALDMLLAPVAGKDGLRTVTKSGVRVDGAYYICPDVLPETMVLVRMDPLDAGRAYLFEPEGAKYLGEAICPDLAGLDPQALVAHAKARQKSIIETGLSEVKRIARPLKKMDLAAAYMRQAAKESGKLVEFPRRVDAYETAQIAAALDALTPEPANFVNNLNASDSAQMAAIEADLDAGRELTFDQVTAGMNAIDQRVDAFRAEVENDLLGLQSAETDNVRPLRSEATPQQKSARARQIEELIRLGKDVDTAEAVWLGAYQRNAEYINFLGGGSQRFRHALRLSEIRASGEPLWPHEELWLKNYKAGAEYQSLQAVYEDFGEAALR